MVHFTNTFLHRMEIVTVKHLMYFWMSVMMMNFKIIIYCKNNVQFYLIILKANMKLFYVLLYNKLYK
jgi:hypothetical protein